MYHLSTCSTCQAIIKELGLRQRGDFEFQDIKTEPITEEQLDGLAQKAGSCLALFSRRAMKYRELGLHEKPEITQEEAKQYILKEYTFLKRPVILVGGRLFVGSEQGQRVAAQEALNGL
ncbi:MAG: arsenate reductase [Cytophagales bacterium]|nr:arsenate reductase [Cytophagales bacterium]